MIPLTPNFEVDLPLSGVTVPLAIVARLKETLEGLTRPACRLISGNLSRPDKQQIQYLQKSQSALALEQVYTHSD